MAREAAPPRIALLQFSPDLQLQTLFVLDKAGRITSTREPNPGPGPRFALVRGRQHCAWAVHADVPPGLAAELDALARDEPPGGDFRIEPVHTARYLSLVGGRADFGPVFTFPANLPSAGESVVITQLSQLEQHFRGWTADELPGRAPILAIVENGHAVSTCFCARRSAVAAEAGLETSERFRGRGFGSRVTAAWAHAIRASGRLPLYSTWWSNHPSLAVARRLRLEACASDWSLSE